MDRAELTRSRTLRGVAIVVLTAVTFLLIVWSRSGLHAKTAIVNYLRAASCFEQGADPYVETLRFGPSNQFKYSPLFALAVVPLTRLPATTLFGAWIIGGALWFWWGVVHWAGGLREHRIWLAFALLACSVELVTSLGIYQINAPVVGLTLLGLAACRDGRSTTGGALLMLATNLKVFPVIFLLGCLRRGGWRYVAGAGATGAVAFLLPALVVGLSSDVALHQSWFRVVAHDTAGSGILDVQSALARLGAAGLGTALRWGVLVVSLTLFARGAARRRLDLREWAAWIALGLCAYVLLSPRTEVATFIVVAPAYVLLGATIAGTSASPARTLSLVLLAMAIALVSLYSNSFTEDHAIVSELPVRGLRVLGTALLLGLSAAGLWSGLRRRAPAE